MRKAALVAAACAWSLAAAATAQAATVIRSDPLFARVQADPWRLELVDRKGRTVLAEHPGHRLRARPARSAFGRRSAGSTRPGSPLRSGPRAGSARELATTDPQRTIALELRRAGAGVIALDARLAGPGRGRRGARRSGFAAPQGERYLGFGERSNAVDQTGGTVENYVADGPYQAEEYPFLAAFVPPWGLRDGREDATYFPIPWLLSSAGYGVLVDNPETSLLPAAQRRRGRLERRGRRRRPAGEAGRRAGAAGRPPAAALLRRPAPGRRAAALQRGGRPPAARRRSVGVRPLVPGRATRPRSWRRCAPPTRRSRCCRPTRTTCPAATSRPRPSGRAWPPRTPAASRSPPTSTRWSARTTRPATGRPRPRAR